MSWYVMLQMWNVRSPSEGSKFLSNICWNTWSQPFKLSERASLICYMGDGSQQDWFRHKNISCYALNAGIHITHGFPWFIINLSALELTACNDGFHLPFYPILPCKTCFWFYSFLLWAYYHDCHKKRTGCWIYGISSFNSLTFHHQLRLVADVKSSSMEVN